jgi:class 3 adenylate cyclase
MMAEQAAQLAELNRRLEERVAEQAGKLERLSYLKQFFSPHLAELIVSAGGEQLLESHRREITVVFCDLRNFTTFSHTAEPEDVMWVLRDYHDALGALVSDFEATLEHYAGDGLMVFFNDPVPCRDPAARAVRMAIAMRESIEELISKWSERGFELGFGVGIALGYATLGTIGFKGQLHYAAIGSVANLASRLCDHATQGQILITRPVYAEVGDLIEVEQLGDVSFKGFRNPVAVLQVTRLKRGTELGHC